MLLPSIDESFAEPLASLREELARATGCPVEVFERIGPRKWRPESTSSELSAHESDCRFVEILESGYEANSVRRHATHDGVETLIVPLAPSEADAAVFAAIQTPGSRAADVERIAQLVVRMSEHESEARLLRDENLAFAQQVTDDFEELTFLRTIAADLAISDSTLTVTEIVQKSLGGLRLMIGAKAIYHVARSDDGVLAVADACRADDAVDALWDDQLIASTADLCRRRAKSGPYICNALEGPLADALAAGINQLLMVPIATSQRRFGWFLALNRTFDGRAWPPSPLLQLGQDEFGTWEASLLHTAASLIASQASNLDLLREKERLLTNTVLSLVSALDAKDAYTRGHSERVAMFSKRIALAMGYSAPAAERLYLAGLLHDVGKIGVSDATLRKPARLTADEFTEMTLHPDEGWSILSDLPQLEYVLPAVLHHHEQFDGHGYPDRLEGEEIPLDARIMAVADAFDAMTSDRAYRACMGVDKAIDILRRGAGRHWDARVVETLELVLDDILAIRRAYQPVERATRSAPALIPHCRS